MLFWPNVWIAGVMLSEREIGLMVEMPQVNGVVDPLRSEFIATASWESPLSEHDFLSTLLMTPSIDLALANGKISLSEELSLNKKARSFSRGGFFLKQDPVVKVVHYLLDQFEHWEDRFYRGLNSILITLLPPSNGHPNGGEGLFETMLNTPYLMIKLVETFFLPEGEEIMGRKRTMAAQEYQKLITIGNKLGFHETPFFQEFLNTFQIR